MTGGKIALFDPNSKALPSLGVNGYKDTFRLLNFVSAVNSLDSIAVCG